MLHVFILWITFWACSTDLILYDYSLYEQIMKITLTSGQIVYIRFTLPLNLTISHKADTKSCINLSNNMDLPMVIINNNQPVTKKMR